MDERDFREFLEIVQKMERCPYCGRKYKKNQIYISGLKKNLFKIEFLCCRRTLATVSLSKISHPQPFEKLKEEKWKN